MLDSGDTANVLLLIKNVTIMISQVSAQFQVSTRTLVSFLFCI